MNDSDLKELSSRYQLLKLLGRGGMGSVYLATDLSLNRQVAIKALSKKSAELNVPRFQREARLMSALKHPNLVEIYDFGTTSDGAAYIVMEYVIGRDLASVLNERTRLALDETLHLALCVADGMAHAHRKNIIHRDLKPANIIVPDDQTFMAAKVLDFAVSQELEGD